MLTALSRSSASGSPLLSQGHPLSCGVLLCDSHSLRALHDEHVSEQLTPHTFMQHTLTWLKCRVQMHHTVHWRFILARWCSTALTTWSRYAANLAHRMVQLIHNRLHHYQLTRYTKLHLLMPNVLTVHHI
jgi:hypothetical protein